MQVDIINTQEECEDFEGNQNNHIAVLDSPLKEVEGATYNYVDEQTRNSRAEALALNIESPDITTSPNRSAASGIDKNDMQIQEALLRTRDEPVQVDPIGQESDSYINPSILESINKGKITRREAIQYIQAQMSGKNDIDQVRSWLVLLQSMEMDYEALKATGIGATVANLSKNPLFDSLSPLRQAILMYWIGLLPNSVLLNIKSITNKSELSKVNTNKHL